MYMQPVYQYQMPAHVAAPQHLQPPPHFQHLPPHEFPPHQQPPPPAWAAVAAAELRAAAPRQRPTRCGAARQRAVGDERGVAAAAVEHAGVGVSTAYSVIDAPSAAPSAAGGGAAPTGFAPFPAYEVQPPPAAVGGTVVDADATAAPSAAAPPPTAPWAPMRSADATLPASTVDAARTRLFFYELPKSFAGTAARGRPSHVLFRLVV